MNRDPVEKVVAVSASPITVRELARGEEAQWDAFVERCPEATFFHRSGWREVIESVFHHRTHFLCAEQAGQIVGVLPLAQVNSWLFGHSLQSLPFCVYGGSAVTDPAAAPALHTEARTLAARLGASHLELRHRATKQADWPRNDELYVMFRKELALDVEANMLAIPRKQRAMVRKGIKNGLIGTIDADVDRFFALYADNVHRHGTPALPKRYFRALRQVFKDDCEILTITEPGGKPISSVLSFYFRDEVLPYYAGDDTLARDLAGNDFKYWELMRRACERKIRIFDYGRSKRGTGSFDFKKNWGFEATPLVYEYALLKGTEIPQNNPSNPKYQAFIAMWRKLPIGVANFLGPYIVRNLG